MTNVFIKTYGCSVNQSDSELMAGLLEKADFSIVDNEEDAFVIIVNTCSVKGPTEKNILKYLDEIKKYPHKKVIITGCLPETVPEKLKKYPFMGTSPQNIVELVEEVMHDNPLQMLEKSDSKRLNLPKIRKNPVVEIIPLCEGCLGDPCAYCIVKKARGGLRSYPKEDILNQVRSSVKEGIPEIWLTAQDTGCYGKDIGSSLPELLDEILLIPGNFKVRLGMLNPDHAAEFLDDLIRIYRSDKMFKFLHIPVQSGNDEILKSMRRKYTAEEFKKVAERFRKEIYGLTISTDIIVGFPGETESQFSDSLDLIKEVRPPVLNISRFWPRPGTEAEAMENQIHGKETKRRSQIMSDIFNNISRMENERWIGWEGEVLIDEQGKVLIGEHRNQGTMLGRNFAYKPVVVEGDHSLGDYVDVKIKRVTSFDLRA